MYAPIAVKGGGGGGGGGTFLGEGEGEGDGFTDLTGLEASGGFEVVGGVSIDPTKTKVKKKNNNLKKGVGIERDFSGTCLWFEHISAKYKKET